DGALSSAIPIGPVATIDPDHSAGFRVGGVMAIDSCSSFAATFTNFQSHTTHHASLPGGTGFLRSLTTHPNTNNVAVDSLDVSSDYDIDFRVFDLDYRAMWCGNQNHVINYVIGFRYAHLDQDFSGDYTILGATNVSTDIDFDGLGPRVGFDAAKLLGDGFLLYTKGSANFLVGDFNADFRQTNIFAGTQAVSGIEDDRIVSILEWELGFGWESCCGGFRATAGYYVAAWFNTLTTPEFIRGVQTSDYDDMSGALSFDGLTIRTEIRF
ncbi:MAG: Lpg1974 family pore-forming outer membrane protein, partial [Planctomycetaceae bacterium]